jgi:hypothetical protein
MDGFADLNMDALPCYKTDEVEKAPTHSLKQGSRHFSMVAFTSGTRGAAHAQSDALKNRLGPDLDPHMWQWPQTLIKHAREKGLRLR